MTMAKKLPLLVPSIHTFEVNGTYTDCEAKRTVFMATMDKVLYPLAGGVMDFDSAAFAGVFVLFFVRAVYRFFGETDRAPAVVVCADHHI